jgi:putative hemolysin
MEDLVEELVGDIPSETEPLEELIRSESATTAVVQGTASLREINRALGLELEEGHGYSTVGGLCSARTGVIPQPGTRLTLEDGTALEVLDSTPQRVRTVRIHLPPQQPHAP